MTSFIVPLHGRSVALALAIAGVAACNDCPTAAEVVGPSVGVPCSVEEGALVCSATPERDPWVYTCSSGKLAMASLQEDVLARCQRDREGTVVRIGQQPVFREGNGSCQSSALSLGRITGPLSGKVCETNWETRCADDPRADDLFYVCHQRKWHVLDRAEGMSRPACFRVEDDATWVHY